MMPHAKARKSCANHKRSGEGFGADVMPRADNRCAEVVQERQDAACLSSRGADPAQRIASTEALAWLFCFPHFHVEYADRREWQVALTAPGSPGITPSFGPLAKR